jgi:PHS family inorganic phosphate transporter-like MFS transporter
VYSPDCRSTLNGISAAFGKAGALLGATMFEPVSEKLGDDKVMLICAGVSVLAFAMTRFFVRLPPVNPEV